MNEGKLDQQNSGLQETDESKIKRILALDIKQFPEFRQNPHFSWQRDASRFALHALQEALKRGAINLSDFHHVVDFGAGGGGPTFILDQICQITDGNVTALETKPRQLSHLRIVVPLVPLHTKDGIRYLESLNGAANLITAFTFGPDENGQLFVKLAKSCAKALTANGKLLLYSDNETLEAVQRKINTPHEGNNNVLVIPQINPGDTYRFSPTTLILTKQGCSLITS